MSEDKSVIDKLNTNHLDADELGEDHIGTTLETPLRDDAFDMADDEKIEIIQKHFKEIMETLGLDMTDQSLQGTPYRVAKMYVNEIFSGLNPKNKPIARKFLNKYDYSDLVVVKNVNVTSFCEHHFLPFLGKAHIGYISGGDVIGLSKINRIVEYYSRRPQVQERLTLQIAEEMEQSLGTENVAVFIESKHLCVATRGIEDRTSSTVTTEYRGMFREKETQQRFIDYINAKTEM